MLMNSLASQVYLIHTDNSLVSHLKYNIYWVLIHTYISLHNTLQYTVQCLFVVSMIYVNILVYSFINLLKLYDF